jgi:hypothetical protein
MKFLDQVIEKAFLVSSIENSQKFVVFKWPIHRPHDTIGFWLEEEDSIASIEPEEDVNCHFPSIVGELVDSSDDESNEEIVELEEYPSEEIVELDEDDDGVVEWIFE